MKLFAQLMKIDEAKRLVYGRATQEVTDRTNEIMDYEKSKPNFAKWSEDVKAATGGKSLGNVRAMHQPISAGRLDDIIYNDAEKAIDIVAHIVDDAEWKKCTEGCYTGFSVGGKYAAGSKTIEKINGRDVTRYTAEPYEISLVDMPCIPTAQFSMVKADGAEELRKFDATVATATDPPNVLQKSDPAEQSDASTTPSTATPASTAGSDPEKEAVDAIAKTIDDGKIKPTEVQALIDAEVAKREGVHKAARLVVLGTELAKDDALTNGEVDALRKEFLPADFAGDNVAAIDALSKLATPVDAPVVEVPKNFRKGLYSVSQLADAVACIDYLCADATWEAAYEGDESPIPDRLRAVRDELAMILVEMADEETRELTDAEKVLAEGLLTKAGARHSKADKDRLQSIHDHSVGMGAQCDTAEKLAQGALAKALGVAADTPAEQLNKTVTEALRKAALWDAAPAAPKGSIRAVTKALDTDPGNADADTSARDDAIKLAVESGDPQELVKLIYQAGPRPGMPPARS